MNSFMKSAYNLATHVARNETEGVARDAFDVVDHAASVLAAEVREQGMDIDALEYALCNERMDSDAAREESAKECARINDRAVEATARADKYRAQLDIVGALMKAGVITPGALYMVIPGVIAKAATELRDGKKINAIKVIYNATGAGLKTCKDWVEDWMAQNAKT